MGAAGRSYLYKPFWPPRRWTGDMVAVLLPHFCPILIHDHFFKVATRLRIPLGASHSQPVSAPWRLGVTDPLHKSYTNQVGAMIATSGVTGRGDSRQRRSREVILARSRGSIEALGPKLVNLT